MNLRKWRRLLALGCTLTIIMLRLVWLRVRGPMDDRARALWLQWACRGVLRAMSVEVRVQGALPARGLVVSNHLSYLDIAVFSAAMTCAFVSKAEVRKWPYFGLAARASGTIFIDRSSKASAAATAAEMRERLKRAVPVLLFPEGTSSDGERVLRFHSSLFQPAVEAEAPVTAAAVRYVACDATAERELCWFGEDKFLSHLWRTLGGGGFSAEVCFGDGRVYGNRRGAALAAYEVVAGMRSGAMEAVNVVG